MKGVSKGNLQSCLLGERECVIIFKSCMTEDPLNFPILFALSAPLMCCHGDESWLWSKFRLFLCKTGMVIYDTVHKHSLKSLMYCSCLSWLSALVRLHAMHASQLSKQISFLSALMCRCVCVWGVVVRLTIPFCVAYVCKCSLCNLLTTIMKTRVCAQEPMHIGNKIGLFSSI